MFVAQIQQVTDERLGTPKPSPALSALINRLMALQVRAQPTHTPSCLIVLPPTFCFVSPLFKRGLIPRARSPPRCPGRPPRRARRPHPACRLLRPSESPSPRLLWSSTQRRQLYRSSSSQSRTCLSASRSHKGPTRFQAPWYERNEKKER